MAKEIKNTFTVKEVEVTVTKTIYSKWERAKEHLSFLFDLFVSLIGAIYFFGLVLMHGNLFGFEGVWRWIISFLVVLGYLLAFRSLFHKIWK